MEDDFKLSISQLKLQICWGVQKVSFYAFWNHSTIALIPVEWLFRGGISDDTEAENPGEIYTDVT